LSVPAVAVWIVSVTAAVLAVAGCSVKKEIDTQRAESEIKRELAAQTGAPLSQVRCPDQVEAKKGAVFRCVAIASDRSRIPVRVTQIDGEGGVRWKIAGSGP
jgi:hypothetical protein